jgi:hypothetical protein
VLHGGQTSLISVSRASCRFVHLRDYDVMALKTVWGSFIAFLLFIAARLISNDSYICRPFALVPPNIEQLLSNRVFRGEAVLKVRLEERLIGIATAPVRANLGRSKNSSWRD